MTRKLLELPIDQVDPGTNVRTKVDADLRRSIEEVGILQPITVTPREDDRFDVLYGHRRLAAARAAGLRTIPAVVEAEPSDLPLRQLVENQQRRAVAPLDIARTLRTYLDEHPGMPQVELARKLGKSGYWVSQKLLLLDMSPALQAQVAAGELRDDLAVKAHRATTVQAGRGRPRVLALESEESRSTSVVLQLPGVADGAMAKATIGLERDSGTIDLTLEDGKGHGVMVTLAPAAARLLGLRLTQAYQATPPAKAKVA